MAEKWSNQDSARKMTQKYNDTVDQVNTLHKQLDKKIDAETAQKDLDEATKNFVTSIQSELTDLSPETEVLVNILINGTKMILDTGGSKSHHKVNVLVQNTKLVFITM